LDVSNLRGFCAQVRGRFVVHEAVYDPVSAGVIRLAVDFEQHCGDTAAPALSGSIRYHSTVPVGTLRPTSTPTGTATATGTETATPLGTLTATRTLTPSKTLTPSVTRTPTVTPTPTVTEPPVPCPQGELAGDLPASVIGDLNFGLLTGYRGSCADGPFFGRAFRFTAPEHGRYVFDTLGSTRDLLLFAREDSCEGTEVACNDDAEQMGGASRLVVSLTAGSEIVVFVGASTSDGFYRVNARDDRVPTCVGDCNGDGQVNIDELVQLVNVAFDGNGWLCGLGLPATATVDVAVLVRAVNNTLSGCPTPGQ
jgi:hypothetical protein